MTPEQTQKHKRINVALWAYAYEIENNPLVPDAVFDKTCLEIDLEIPTGDPLMDCWFREHFNANTGQWIHKHPFLPQLRDIYLKLEEFTNKESLTK